MKRNAAQWATGSRLPAVDKQKGKSSPSLIGRSPVAGSRLSREASGFSLVAALFLIVVLAALGAFAVRIGASEQQTVNLQLLSARALAAANSGIEFGAYRALVNGSCVNTTLNLTEAGVNGFTVNVTCIPTTHTEGSVTPNNVNVYRIDATAFAGVYGMPDYVSRHVFATFTNVP